MNSARELPRRDYDALKDATKALVESFANLAEAVEVTGGRSDKARLSRYGNRHEEGMFAPIDVIADLESRLGKPVVTAILADMLGFVLVPKEEAKRQPDFAHHVGSVAKETGEAVSALAMLIDPSARTAQNIAKAQREIREAEERLAGADQVLDALAGNVTPIRGSAA